MKTLSFYQVMEACIGATGWTMDSPETANRLPLIAELIGDWTRSAFEAEFWPDTMRIEKRAVLKTDDGEFYVEKGNPWDESPIGAIDRRRALFAERPVLPELSGALAQVGEYDNRITCADEDLGDPVYVYFQTPPPEFSVVEYSADEVCSSGDVRYDKTARNCYMSRQDANSGHALTEPDWWKVQAFPEFIKTYVKWGVASEFISEEEGMYKTQAKAGRELNRLKDAVHWTAGR
jgi:hypothetical protein